MKKILTIDGNNLVHRVYWVANNMKKKSENFHVYMFLNAVKSYTDMYKADKVICVWDEKPDYRKNKRKELLEEYKVCQCQYYRHGYFYILCNGVIQNGEVMSLYIRFFNTLQS